MITISVVALIGIIIVAVILVSLVLLFTFSVGNTNEWSKGYDKGYAAGLKENFSRKLPKRIPPEQVDHVHRASYIEGWNACLDKMES